ncbi:type VI secretion system tube protein TssD [Rapidithrix thailandica]|uniref:Type VI secretion system tube protein TssD n=1 Tax=Rapidithrix thailandica TaxID=413964 RepID=A0AAW9SAX2_9BACT
MSLIAKMYVEDKEINILDFKFRFTRSVDEHGKPMGKPNGTIFDITFETTSDQSFFAWSVGMDMVKKVKIVVSPVTQDSKSRVFELYDVHCVFFKNNFNGVNGEPMTTQIKLSPAILYDGGYKILEHYWKETDLSAKKIEPISLADQYDNLTAGAGNILPPVIEDPVVEEEQKEDKPHRTCGIAIVGTAQYRTNVLKAIALLIKTQEGARLIETLLEWGRLTVIHRGKGRVNRRHGQGTAGNGEQGAWVYFDPEYDDFIEVDNVPRIPYISLGHELRHVERGFGSDNRFLQDSRGDYPEAEHPEYEGEFIRLAEVDALYVENIIRASVGAPIRYSYDGLDLKHIGIKGDKLAAHFIDYTKYANAKTASGKVNELMFIINNNRMTDTNLNKYKKKTRFSKTGYEEEFIKGDQVTLIYSE